MIQIGFLEKVTVSNLLNKVGGYPAYLGKVLDQTFCQVCQDKLCFLMQLFTPEEKGTIEINRCIHVFVCPRNHE
jgi:hypothetical protein